MNRSSSRSRCLRDGSLPPKSLACQAPLRYRRGRAFGGHIVTLALALGCVPDATPVADPARGASAGDTNRLNGTAGAHTLVAATTLTQGGIGSGGFSGTESTASSTGAGPHGGSIETAPHTQAGGASSSRSTTGGTESTSGSVQPSGGIQSSGGTHSTSGSGQPSGGIQSSGGATSNPTGGNPNSSSASNSTLTCTDSVKFDPLGREQSFKVPACATKLFIQAYGASGGNAYNLSGVNPVGGKGAYLEVVLDVSALGLSNETLYVNVGAAGENGTAAAPGLGGWNGGGNGGYRKDPNTPAQWVASAAGGGGATDLRRGGHDLASRIVVAAGGGGASGGCSSEGGTRPGGGNGGLASGESGALCFSFNTESAGGGGTQTEGGLAGNIDTDPGYACLADDGLLGFGGSGCDIAGGGGGGGYFGGGGGAWGGGGGGSSYVAAGLSSLQSISGEHTGAGLMIISFT